jgi:hypothetical protein
MEVGVHNGAFRIMSRSEAPPQVYGTQEVEGSESRSRPGAISPDPSLSNLKDASRRAATQLAGWRQLELERSKLAKSQQCVLESGVRVRLGVLECTS